MAVLRRIAAIAAAMLPARFWPVFDEHLPVQTSALYSGLLTLAVGGLLGVSGFVEHAQALGDVDSNIWLAAAGWRVSADPRTAPFPGLSSAALFTFLLFTPQGWAAMYLTFSGGFRAVAAAFDDPFGDPLLTAVAAGWCGARDRRRAREAAVARLRLEGPEVADRVVTGAQAGFPAADLVVVSSRAKPGWTPGTVVDAGDAFYRIGDPVERTVAGRLRTMYPLSRHPGVEAIRRSVQYRLPRP